MHTISRTFALQIQDGARSNSARNYIEPALSRSNLDVIVKIQFASGPTAKVYSAVARNEVILSAGAIGTPRYVRRLGSLSLPPVPYSRASASDALRYRSSAQSKAMKISTLVDLPDVGQNINMDTLDQLISNTTPQNEQNEQLNQWLESRTGDFTLDACNQWAWGRLPSTEPILKTVTDPSAGTTSPHYQLIFSDLFIAFGGAASTTSRSSATSTPLPLVLGCGNLTMKSSSPWDYPIINPGLLGDKGGFDIYTIREARRGPQGRPPLHAGARLNALVVNHVSGTVAMGKKNTIAKDSGALNPDFIIVKGTVGLRVVDVLLSPSSPPPTRWSRPMLSLSVLLTSSRAASVRHEVRESRFDELIPKPRYCCKRIHKIGDGSSLQEQMGMTECGEEFIAILSLIRSICVEYGINHNVPYRKQSKAKLQLVKDNVLSKLSMLNEFENAWPIDFYLIKELKLRGGRSGAAVSRSTYKRTALRSGQPNSSRPLSMPASAVGGSAQDQGVASQIQRPPRPNRAYVEVPGTTPRAEYRRPVNTTTTTGTASSTTIMTGPGTNPNAPARQTFQTFQPILNLLLAYALPRTDAQRLVDLFTSKGVADIAYLRVMARMGTRDGWLNELREKGELSEIQMRVVREVLERFEGWEAALE
ncbi:hypothetical protein C8Q80DRAFT_1273784 [Daedaleopsis nitida]|nr:hypothetical protein C8Q80DRAFT_1273784 [Daedaleopsis nitida]